MFNIEWDDKTGSNSSKFKLSTIPDIEFVVGGSIRDQAKVRDANLYPVIYLSPAVLWFACQMEAKLRLPRVAERGDSFKSCTRQELLDLLDAEIVELKKDLQKAEPKNAEEECVDVANFAMFIAINRAIERGVAK